MAPRGRSAAQRVAAARRKWKVGDLVLAKVKGFPAWPATVGEPEKWGHSADSKKVVVCFFGCEQIAFCNPADIEEFTEEKKVSLLGKRHGKGADFGRAVNEIIKSFEKLRKQNEVGEATGSEVKTIANENSSEQSPTKSVKCEAPDATGESLQTEATNDLNCLSETAIAAAAEASLPDEERQVMEASSGLVLPEPPSTSGSRGNKTKLPRVYGSSESRRSTLRSRSRSSSRAGTEGLGSGRSRRTRSLRRSSRIMKLSDDSEQAADPHDSVSDDGNEESDSEIMSVDSDTVSVNDGSNSEFNSKSTGSRISAENNAMETELSDRLDFQNETPIIKKKRKPSRKRLGNDSSASAKLGIVGSDAEAVNSFHDSPSFAENSAQTTVKDGDEHLPLVKRARLRMGRSSPSLMEEVFLVSKSPKEECKDPGIPSAHSHDRKVGSLAEMGLPIVNEEQPNSSLSCVSPDIKSHNRDFKKNPADGEATLPPSKRIHRALEAMSANAADDTEEALHDSPAASVYTKSYYPSIKECSQLLPGKNDSIELVSEAAKDVDDHESGLCIVPDAGILEENDAKMILAAVDFCETNVHNTNHELQSKSPECLKTADSVPEISALGNLVAEIGNVHRQLDSTSAGDKYPTSPKISPSDQCKNGSSNMDNTEEKIDPSLLQVNSDFEFVEEDVGVPPGFEIAINIDNADREAADKCNTTGLVPENTQEAKRSESDEEATLPSLDSSVLTSVDLSDNVHDQALLTSVSCEYVDDTTISVTQSFCATDGQISSAMASPPCSFKSSVPVTDNIFLENTISQSPYSHLHPEKLRPANRSSSREESLLAFESMVGSLTRTKDSIGRATRMAIDAARLGLAPKVVEILVCILERESSLHKKVNLFFLVDSITQCSRAMKGDGGVYPSAVQAMLPRLLSAAAPPGSSSNENHRQCLKVLKVWLERKIIPEPIIRHHIRELEAFCCPYPAVGSRRPQRNERAFDDPVRQMEGMLVDEYGSNSSIQLPGFCMPPIRCDSDGRNDSDGENPESIQRNVDSQDAERASILTVEKRVCILEDVEGELEMEDVAPFCEVNAALANNSGADGTQILHNPSNGNSEALFIRQQEDAQLASAPSSRHTPQPPPPRPNSPSVFPPVAPADDFDSKHFSSSQNCTREFRESVCNQSGPPRVKSTTEATNHRLQANGYFDDHAPRKPPDSNSACPVNRPKSHFSGRASSDFQRSDGFSKGFHPRPPQPAASSHFSYVHDREQSRRDNAPHSHYNRYRMRDSENNNFYRYRDRNKFSYRDHSGDYWRPPYPYNSGPCYQDNGRVNHAPPSSGGPSREPPFPNNRWNCPPGPMNHRHVNHYNHCEGPIPVENRASDYWRPR